MWNVCVGWMLIFVAVTCGCSESGRPTFPAGGTVMLSDGTPLPGGWIEFQLVGEHAAPTAKARIQADGRFELTTYFEGDGALEGTHRVMIMPPIPRQDMRSNREDPHRVTAELQAAPQIDKRYQRFETSDLTFAVTSEPAENRFEIRLEMRE